MSTDSSKRPSVEDVMAWLVISLYFAGVGGWAWLIFNMRRVFG